MNQNQTLATLIPRTIEEFLVELLNLHPNGTARFARRFAAFLFDPRILKALTDTQIAQRNRRLVAVIGPKDQIIPRAKATAPVYIDDLGEFGKVVEKDTPDVTKVVEEIIVPYFYEMFRATWLEPDAKTRQWGWAILRTDLARIWVSGSSYLSLWDDNSERFRLPQPPKELPIEKAFDYLLKHHQRTRYCPNPECAAPYFFAKRHTQKYCSEKCAQHCERESKRRWWAEHGEEWRTARQSKKPSKRRAGKGKSGKRPKQTTKKRR